MRQPDMRGILNPRLEMHVVGLLLDECRRAEADISASITARILDRDAYLTKMGELNGVRALTARLASICKGEFE